MTYSENIETSNLPSILGGLSLRVIEVGRDSDDCVLGVGAEVSLSCFLHLGQGESSHLTWRVDLAIS